MTTTAPECFAWLQPAWQSVYARHQSGRLPHALLFSGLPGIGKRDFARFVAQALACTQPDAMTGACQRCDRCQQWLAGSLPDFRWLTPEEPGGAIKVDAVRALVDWMQLTSSAGATRVALIDPADAMNRNAANSLLKTLEEPGDSAVMLLVCDRPGALPPTVRSRCQSMVLRLGDPQPALHWLGEVLPPDAMLDAPARLAEGRVGPCRLREQVTTQWAGEQQELLLAWRDLILHRRSVGRLVDALVPHGTRVVLQGFARGSHLAARASMGAPMKASAAEVEVAEAVSGRLQCEKWFTLHTQILRLQRIDSASFKPQAVLEGLLADIRSMVNG